jgi:hypothetical protein
MLKKPHVSVYLKKTKCSIFVIIYARRDVLSLGFYLNGYCYQSSLCIYLYDRKKNNQILMVEKKVGKEYV